MNKFGIKKSNTFNSKGTNILVPEKTIKEEEEQKYETILKKSKTLIFEKSNTLNRFKAALETIHEVSNSKIDSSELSDYKEDIPNNEINDNNG